MNSQIGSKTLYLIDGHSYLYRAFHAIPHLSNSKGLPTNAVYGFTTMLLKIIREKKPDYLAVIFDSDKPTHRHEAFEGYKAHRPRMPDSLIAQIPYVRTMLERLRVPLLLQDGIEADDLIATLAKKAEREGMRVMVVTGDKDLYQLVSPAVFIYDSLRDKVYGEQEVRERFGVSPSQIVEILGLMGDSVDNIPGVPGVGEKTAADLIRQFGSIDKLLADLDAVKKPKLRESIRSLSQQVLKSRDLAMLNLNIPWEGRMDQLKRAAPDLEMLREFFTELEFSSLLKNLDQIAESEPS